MNSGRLPRVMFWFSCLVIVFCAGVYVGVKQVFPYSLLLEKAPTSVKAVVQEQKTVAGIRPEHFLNKARYAGKGVTTNVPSDMSPGLTLLQGFFDDNNEIRLVKSDGTIVHRWPVRFSALIKDTSHIKTDFFVPKTDWNVEIHGVVAQRDGSIVFSFERSGLVKLDRCGKVLWTLPRMTHHSVSPAEGGGYWTPGIRFVDRAEGSVLALLGRPYFEDTLLRISADGRVMNELSYLGLIRHNHLEAAILFANGLSGIQLAKDPEKTPEEITHVNAVEELTSAKAPMFPQFKAGDLLISERDYNLLMVLDPRTQEVKWFQRGPWLGQHDPHFESNGHISVLSNNADGTDDGHVLGGSTIIEVDPTKPSDGRAGGAATSVTYDGAPDHKWYTLIRGKEQRLPNGGLLITESEAGRVFEVDRSGRIVWEFVNRYDADSAAIVTQAIRYPADYFTVTDWSCSAKGK